MLTFLLLLSLFVNVGGAAMAPRGPIIDGICGSGSTGFGQGGVCVDQIVPDDERTGAGDGR